MTALSSFTDICQVPWNDYVGNIAGGLLKTLGYTMASFVGATILGLALALMRLNRLRVVRVPAALYTELFKNVPLLAIIFLTYFGLPSIGIRLEVFEAGVLSLVLFYAAYLSEIFRAAIAGVHRGQQEASQALGLGRGKTFSHVVLPQAVRPTISPMIGQAIVLVKDSSLLSLISVVELTRVGQQIALDRFMPVEGLAATAAGFLLIYYLLKAMAGTWSRFNRMPER